MEISVILGPPRFYPYPRPEARGTPLVRIGTCPEGADQCPIDDGVFGERYTRTENGFGDTDAILPGVGIREIVVFLELPYKRSLNFSQKISLPIDSVIVMSPQGLKIKSDICKKAANEKRKG